MRIHLLSLFLFVLAPAVAPAQGAPDGDVAETARRYTVELIIFAYKIPDSVGSELFVPPLLDDEAAALEFGDAVSLPALPPPEDSARDPGYRILTADEYTLADTWGMLSRLQAYEPLMHFGWVQDTRPQATAHPLALELFDTPPDGLAGSVSLVLSRYLHLGVDLTLAADGPAVPEHPPVADDRSAARATGRDEEPARPRYAPLNYTLKETRIMKSGETRYFDHPHFGVIARVTRAEETGATLSRR